MTSTDSKILSGWQKEANSGLFIHSGDIFQSENFEELTLGGGEQGTGIYIIVVMLEITGGQGNFTVSPRVNNKATIKARYTSFSEKTFTLSTFGVIRVKQQSSTFDVIVKSDTDTEYSVEPSSTSSMIRIEATENTPGFSGYVSPQKLHLQKNIWKVISNWEISRVDWHFKQGDGFTTNSYTVSSEGTYYFSTNVILSFELMRNTQVELVMMHNHVSNPTQTLYSRENLDKGETTMHLSSTLYLKKWDYIQIAIRTDSNNTVNIVDGSTIGIAKVGE